jgi:hypothetical protein
MFYVAVGEDHDIHCLLADDLFHAFFFYDWNSLGIKLARQRGRISLIRNIGDLGGGESYDLVFGVVAKDNVKVMEVPAGGSEN